MRRLLLLLILLQLSIRKCFVYAAWLLSCFCSLFSIETEATTTTTAEKSPTKCYAYCLNFCTRRTLQFYFQFHLRQQQQKPSKIKIYGWERNLNGVCSSSPVELEFFLHLCFILKKMLKDGTCKIRINTHTRKQTMHHENTSASANVHKILD